MKIYNTLTRRKEDFVPIQEGKVGIYVCGPTVYDFIHIGNARPMIVFDTLRRYLEHKGYEVNFVSNFTDIDDKIINRSIQEGIPAGEVSEKYIAECKKDMEALNVRTATTHPQATKEIPEMIDMVQTLIDKGHAYEKNGTVYFRVRSFDGYGKLSHKNIDDLESGHRADAHALKVSGEDEKEDSLDFVLWKPKKEGEPFWNSPWGEGRPGWHLECSCMSKKYVGETIDIHAGGEDLIFPHHENEIAQSEATNDKPFANYWMHNGFLKINGDKMSKSLGNFFTVRDICAQYDPQVLRFFMLSAQYRTPLNFSRDLIEDSAKGLERILNGAEKLTDIIAKDNKKPLSDEEKKLLDEELPKFVQKFDEAMDDDLNTADAVSAVFELIRFTNASTNTESSSDFAQALYDTLSELSEKVLGIKLTRAEESMDDSFVAKIEELIAERTAAKKEKNFARADEIRAELLGMGIVIEDTREGVKWKKA
ncbi:MAG: cysteine--tRNA ligase [Eubacterium sp.]|nr:cysteine--tRNA ligase [Eubacterium sp.]